jgi:hypothetical protein
MCVGVPLGGVVGLRGIRMCFMENDNACWVGLERCRSTVICALGEPTSTLDSGVSVEYLGRWSFIILVILSAGNQGWHRFGIAV